MFKSVFAVSATLSLVAIAAVPASVLAQPVSEKGSEALSAKAPPQGSARTAPNRTFTGEDLFDLAYATDPQISPDGSRIAYVRRQNDIMADRALNSIWMIDTDTGKETPFAAGEGGSFSPRWSPDGSRVAYVSTKGGSAQLWVKWLDGEAVRLTGLPNSPSSIAWSPDGERIAYVARCAPVRGLHIYLIDLREGIPRRLDVPLNHPQFPTWMPY